MKKILFVANSKYVITHFRGELVDELLKLGHSVKLVCPVGKDVDGKHVTDGVISIPLSRGGINPIRDLQTFLSLSLIMIKEKPDVIMNFTIKPVIYASLAGGLFTKAKIFSNITGLGYLFTESAFKTKILRKMVTSLYRVALRFNQKVFFQNPDDEKLFITLGIINSLKAKRISGSGINLEKLQPELDRSKKEMNSFVFIGRLLKDKGVNEVVEAARIVKNKHPNAAIYIIGEGDKNPNSLTSKEIEIINASGIVKFLGRINDIKPFLKKCEVFVFPSYYGEGTPRSVLEAMACGLPIITTDSPGCRETVIDGKNGFLIPIKSPSALAEKMIFFIENPEKITEMGNASLEYARSKYDVRLVNTEILKTIELT